MGIKKFAIAALLVAAGLGITTATAQGQAANAVRGIDQGVVYTAGWASDYSSVSTTLDNGIFRITPDAVEVAAPSGAVIASIPMVLGEVRLDPRVDAAGTTLTIDRPATAPAATSPEAVVLKDIASAGQIIAGIAIGCVVGALIGLIFFLVGAIPGCIIGAVIGGIIAAEQR
ncbi:hypothetical protein [Nocardia crassostreae]|uniref:hypothetical protein n=1 Tax=Nocardia crassostreae TaxID=53428 RepID=UPI0008345518|nr:hypothetical protein [Nocardia crassostreae]